MAATCYRKRSRGAFMWRRLIFITIVFLISAAFTHVVNKGEQGTRDNSKDLNIAKSSLGRDRLVLLRHLTGASYTDTDDQADDNNSSSNSAEKKNCTPATIHEFPSDFFTNEQREKGAVILHAICVIYMFLALAIVCDDYFVSSLEKICEHLGFSEDVAGATFMAAGSSAPELFTSVIGVFIAKGDVGVGTIVGSAVFNILVIIGICGVFAGQVVPLTWWPLFRDTLVYGIAVVTLVCVIYDGDVFWYESMIMLIFYAGYIFLMWLNPKIYVRIEKRAEKRKNSKRKDMCNNKTAIQLEQVAPLNAPPKEEAVNGGEKTPVAEVDEYISDSPKRLTFSDAGLRLMLSKQFPARTRLRTACWLIITEKQMMERDPEYVDYLRRSSSTNGTVRKQSMDNGDRTPQESTLTTPIPESPQKAALNSSDSTIPVSNHSVHDDDDGGLGSRRATLEALGIEPEGLCHVPNGWWEIIKWLICLPLCTLMYFTIPDCRRKRFERWYLMTFIASIIWIALFSYVMVWMVALIGYTLRVPDTIMGITFLAAGTSVPDAMASLIVARQGLGDMAVSNSIGSNVFDILLGLALPWFIKSTMVSYGTPVTINSNGLIYSAILLFATVALTISCIHFNKWKLTNRVGYLLFAFYAVFLTLSILVEFNVFGYVNPPMCRNL